jgi:hypothetical protein
MSCDPRLLRRGKHPYALRHQPLHSPRRRPPDVCIGVLEQPGQGGQDGLRRCCTPQPLNGLCCHLPDTHNLSAKLLHKPFLKGYTVTGIRCGRRHLPFPYVMMQFARHTAIDLPQGWQRPGEV